MSESHAESLASEGPQDKGDFVTYEAGDISPDASFLEMLDVVNEEPDRERRGADRFRPRLPRGDLRHLRRW